MGAKTERMRRGPASRFYNDDPDCYAADREYPLEKWERVTLPHDYLAGDVPEEKYNPALGIRHYDGAWYRKHFTLPKSDDGQTHYSVFRGRCDQLHGVSQRLPYNAQFFGLYAV